MSSLVLLCFVMSYVMLMFACVTAPAGSNITDAPVYCSSTGLLGPAVACHGIGSSTGLSLHAAPDHPSEDADSASPLYQERASKCECHQP